jgi:hypothetical protein
MSNFIIELVMMLIASFTVYAIFHFKYQKQLDYLDSHNEYLTKELHKVREDYYDTHDKYQMLLANKQEALIEGLEGVKSVSVSALKYVELLSKEKELLELKTKLKDM